MKVRCVYNNGKVLREYDNKPLSKDELGQFGTTEYTEFGLIIGKEYLVMGMMLLEK